MQYLLKNCATETTHILELRYKNARILAASTYLALNEEIDNKTAKIKVMLQYSKGSGILTAMDSNTTSTIWHDKQTNSRGKMLEEYLISRDLHIMNEESELTKFQSRRGSCNLDVTIVNNRLLKILSD
jgi:hypothetical protein